MRIRGQKGHKDTEQRTVSRAAQWERLDADRVVSDDMDLINRFTQVALKENDVHIRSMLLASDQICQADWLRFPTEELLTIEKLTPGESVLRGHDKSSLPLCRFFKAEIVDMGEMDELSGEPIHRVRAWYYWMRGVAGADDLVRNIDGGIYREVSISWRYKTEECSLCKKDWYSCEHTAGQQYEDGLCYFNVREVTDVLEGSFVYAGADDGSVTLSRDRLNGESPEEFVRRTFEEAAPAMLGKSVEEIKRILAELTDQTDQGDQTDLEDGDREVLREQDERDTYLREEEERLRDTYLHHIAEEVRIDE